MGGSGVEPAIDLSERSAQFQLCKHYRLLLSGVIPEPSLLAITRCSICSPTTCNAWEDTLLIAPFNQSHRSGVYCREALLGSWGVKVAAVLRRGVASRQSSASPTSLNKHQSAQYSNYPLLFFCDYLYRIGFVLTPKNTTNRHSTVALLVHRGWWLQRELVPTSCAEWVWLSL